MISRTIKRRGILRFDATELLHLNTAFRFFAVSQESVEFLYIKVYCYCFFSDFTTNFTTDLTTCALATDEGPRTIIVMKLK